MQSMLKTTKKTASTVRIHLKKYIYCLKVRDVYNCIINVLLVMVKENGSLKQLLYLSYLFCLKLNFT